MRNLRRNERENAVVANRGAGRGRGGERREGRDASSARATVRRGFAGVGRGVGRRARGERREWEREAPWREREVGRARSRVAGRVRGGR